MSPERSKVVGDQKIEEFYWAGKMVVYINNWLSALSYEAAVETALLQIEESRSC
jgi:hypothetical protein